MVQLKWWLWRMQGWGEMKREKDKNIFETAGKLGKEQPPEREAPPPKQAPLPDASRYRDPEVDEMMKKIKEMKEDLQSQIESISKKSGLSYDKIRKMIENPKNFSPAAWERMQKNQQILGDKIWGALGKRQAQHSSPSQEEQPQQRENKAGSRKAKTLGARKKWIPIK
jgi:hypothetical protein